MPSPARNSLVADDQLILVARIGAAHGLKGEVRVKSLTAEPLAILDYSPLAAGDGRSFEVEAARPAGASQDMLIVRFKGVGDRNAAEALNGTELYVPRSRLPAAGDDEYYHADLIGLAAVTTAGDPLGTVIAVQNFGAGDLLEVAPRRGDTILLPFTRAVVPDVDLTAGRVVVDPPPGLLDERVEDE